MRGRVVRNAAAALLVTSVLVAGCTAETSAQSPSEPPLPPATATPAPTPDERRADPYLVTMRGLRNIDIGASLNDLVAAGLVSTEAGACGPTFPDMPYASPVFDGDRLVLIWAHSPLRTPERVTVGTPLAEARQAYPNAVELTRPPGAIDYPGLLVPGADGRAFLLLHDGSTVQKLVVGFEDSARRLFETGFGSC
jgi:hypothetical protein